MRNFKRWASILLGAALVSSVLTGCGGGASQTPAAEGGQQEAAAEVTGEAPVVKIALPTLGNYDNEVKVEEAIDAKLAEAGVNAKVDLRFMSFGNYDEQLNLMLTNPGEVDMAFTMGGLASRLLG